MIRRPRPVDGPDSAGGFPASVRQLVDVLGMPGAMAVVRAFGGTTLYVPASDRPEVDAVRRLSESIGDPVARQLITHYSGERIYVARCAHALRDVRDTLIQSAYDSGRKVPDIARQHQLTERQIWTILKRPIPPSVQSDDRQSPSQANLF